MALPEMSEKDFQEIFKRSQYFYNVVPKEDRNLEIARKKKEKNASNIEEEEDEMKKAEMKKNKKKEQADDKEKMSKSATERQMAYPKKDDGDADVGGSDEMLTLDLADTKYWGVQLERNSEKDGVEEDDELAKFVDTESYDDSNEGQEEVAILAKDLKALASHSAPTKYKNQYSVLLTRLVTEKTRIEEELPENLATTQYNKRVDELKGKKKLIESHIRLVEIDHKLTEDQKREAIAEFEHLLTENAREMEEVVSIGVIPYSPPQAHTEAEIEEAKHVYKRRDDDEPVDKGIYAFSGFAQCARAMIDTLDDFEENKITESHHVYALVSFVNSPGSSSTSKKGEGENEEEEEEEAAAGESEKDKKKKKKREPKDIVIKDYKSAGDIYVIMNKIPSDDTDGFFRAADGAKSSSKTFTAFTDHEKKLGRLDATEDDLREHADTFFEEMGNTWRKEINLFPDGKKNPRGFLPQSLITLLSSAALFGEPTETRLINGIIKNGETLSSLSQRRYEMYHHSDEIEEISGVTNQFVKFPDSDLYAKFIEDALLQQPHNDVKAKDNKGIHERYTVVKCSKGNFPQGISALSQVSTRRSIPLFPVLNYQVSCHFVTEKAAFDISKVHKLTIERNHMTQAILPNIKDIVQLLSTQSLYIFDQDSMGSKEFIPEKVEHYLLDLMLSNSSLNFRKFWSRGLPLGIMITFDDEFIAEKGDPKYCRDLYLWPADIPLGLWLFVLAWGEFKRFCASPSPVNMDPRIDKFLRTLAKCLRGGLYSASRYRSAKLTNTYDRALFIRTFGTMPEMLVRTRGNAKIYNSISARFTEGPIRYMSYGPLLQIIHSEELLASDMDTLGTFAQSFLVPQ